jgi:hypothetical protein
MEQTPRFFAKWGSTHDCEQFRLLGELPLDQGLLVREDRNGHLVFWMALAIRSAF